MSAEWIPTPGGLPPFRQICGLAQVTPNLPTACFCNQWAKNSCFIFRRLKTYQKRKYFPIIETRRSVDLSAHHYDDVSGSLLFMHVLSVVTATRSGQDSAIAMNLLASKMQDFTSWHFTDESAILMLENEVTCWQRWWKGDCFVPTNEMRKDLNLFLP